MNIIKQLRQQSNLTQQELGEKLNIQKSAISKYETGRTRPSLETLQKLSSIFKVSVETLLNGLGIKIEEFNQEAKQPKDLTKFLNQTEIMFDGETYKLNPESRQKLRNALEFAFYEAKKMNKRKKD
ncbi:helix-turn-helix domain-containing protein [Pectinatus frisingensis]|uniref:helix-turn-helix domain-containing protein n=1 Tax=Pectinatus frisingensis TaxID=865 RepID=UPI0018C5B4E5|nr:helix-turn-helix transcriptional regulator [Pectinatus frisingensis]